MKAVGCLVLGFVVLFALYKAWYWLAAQIIGQAEGTKLPEALEASGALFSGLAFLAAIGTLWAQREDLKLQREELQATREELKGQKEQMKLQNSTTIKQNFESTFFNLLRVHKEYSMDLDRDKDPGVSLVKAIHNDFVEKKYWADEVTFRLLNEKKQSFVDIYRENKSYIESGKLRHIIRIWHSVVEYVCSQSSISDQEKHFYLQTFMSQMSEYQCAFFAMHATQGEDCYIIETAIEKYGLLRCFQLNMLQDDFKQYYESSAFERTFV